MVQHLPAFPFFLALMLALVGIEPDGTRYTIRKDDRGEGGLNVGHWVALIISAMVLVIVVAALWTTFTTALNNYSTNETTFGPTVKTIVPILVGVGILLAFVVAFLPSRIGLRRA